ncbi:Protein phosphatase 2C 7 [Striga hermonthica]|uniref:protein-serine/threonine phosphatase n=1 Tax=Striga hermonthica TaxID=68872 RepID=A0A9N7NGH2_STRHE|nr:Protein phosphatase 2C 7 [Striga hermonthica]
MDEFSSLISLPFKLGNLITEDKSFNSHVESAGIELVTGSITILPEKSMTKLPLVPVIAFENKKSKYNVPLNGVVVKIESSFDMSSIGEDESGSFVVVNNAVNKEIEKDDQTGLVGGPLATIVDSPYTMNDAIGETSSGPISCNNLDEIDNIIICRNIIKKSDSWVGIAEDLSVEKTREAVPKRTFSASLVEVPQESKMIKHNLPLNALPLWGLTSICGRRSEMEDSVVALPRFLSIPSCMLSDNPVFTSVHKDLTGHVFGVFDGHGGWQVSDYCREYMHLALADEVRVAREKLPAEVFGHNLNEQWLKIFRNCFKRLDDEVGGFARGNGESDDSPVNPIAPDSVGSTAVVAVVCTTHVIVANCGDSRAVLNRGKVPVPLSVDHRPNREDECARIEGSGGKVINWDGPRVSGVLAVSRSIGDRHLRPHVIADPELMIVPRTKEDECLILASDGLWDVMTNEEACDLARKRILLWHKKNGPTLPQERGHGVDPAAQDAADYLSRFALQRGSRDNISVIVVDLKAQRKFKKKM